MERRRLRVCARRPRTDLSGCFALGVAQGRARVDPLTTRHRKADISGSASTRSPGIDYMDPALASSPPSGLGAPRHRRAPAHDLSGQAAAGGVPPPCPRSRPAFPSISHDGKRWTFTLRSGFRFSDGAPVRASAFARAINRTLAPGMNSRARSTRGTSSAPRTSWRAGTTAAGVVARGNTLVVRSRGLSPTFPLRTTIAVLLRGAAGASGRPRGGRRLPGAGPYYVAEYRPGERVVIRRNRFYRGRDPTMSTASTSTSAPRPAEVLRRDRAGRGRLGTHAVAPSTSTRPGLAAKYGINRSQFFVGPGLTLRILASTPRGRCSVNNPSLRKAVNFALDRRRCASAGSIAREPPDRPVPAVRMPGIQGRPHLPARRPDLHGRGRSPAATRGAGRRSSTQQRADPVALAQSSSSTSRRSGSKSR